MAERSGYEVELNQPQYEIGMRKSSLTYGRAKSKLITCSAEAEADKKHFDPNMGMPFAAFSSVVSRMAFQRRCFPSGVRGICGGIRGGCKKAAVAEISG